MKLHITVTKSEAAEYVRKAVSPVAKDNFLDSVVVEVLDSQTTSEAAIKELIQLALDGKNKIGFIKSYRTITGVGLKEAKDASEALIPAFSQRF